MESWIIRSELLVIQELVEAKGDKKAKDKKPVVWCKRLTVPTPFNVEAGMWEVIYAISSGLQQL